MTRLEAMLFGEHAYEEAVKTENIDTQISPLHNIGSSASGTSHEAAAAATTSTSHHTATDTSEISHPSQLKHSRVNFKDNITAPDISAAEMSQASATGSKHKQQLDKPPHLRSVAALFICRMILPPLFVLLFIQLAIAIGLLRGDDSDKLLRLVVFLESSAPPAQILIVSLNQLTLPRVAGGMAYLYIFMYSFSILTITFWTTIAIYTIY